ncbi:MAG: DNA circularization N-terminal domain-containing protein [Zoogloeaceae bacterium]|jgi:prophage DNA circulation protein|nr:DNA circularization N-terminal domain-containing protein [Zoogloeaceae bacterium]
MSRARFRDFEFLTDSHDAKSGRRLAVHEYPGSEIPNVEDLGGKAWDWSVNAYFIGADYDYKRNEFLALLAEPGAAWLTHPWLGLLWARAREWSLAESNDKGGYCVVKVSFVPGGESPQPTLDKGDAARAAAGRLADVAKEEFKLEPMSADAAQSYIAALRQRLEGLRRILSLATLPITWASQVMNVIQGVKGDLAAIAAIPQAYAAAFRGIANALGLGGRDDLAAVDHAGVVGRVGLAAGTSRKAVTLTGANITDAALIFNLKTEYELEQRLMVAATLHLAICDYPTDTTLATALAAVKKATAAILPTAPDSVFQAAVTARAAVLAALLDQDLRQSVTRSIVTPLPAVLIAHNLGVGEEKFMQRNAIRHPLFVNGAVYG